MKKEAQPGKILVYTRRPREEYTESLSNSIHFAYGEGENDFVPLNRNYGILFVQAVVDGNNVIQEKGLKNPYLFRTGEGSFGIIAVRVEADGKEDVKSRGQILLWTSKDLLRFCFAGFIRLHDTLFVENAVCEYDIEKKVYEICWQDGCGDWHCSRIESLDKREGTSLAPAADAPVLQQLQVNIPDSVPGNILSVDSAFGNTFRMHWTPLYNTEILVPDSVEILSREELDKVKATAVYSDGSTAEKRVEWDCGGMDFSVPGTYTVKGRVVQETYPFPLASGYADPVILPWNNKYYYVATNDNKNDIGIYVREADTIMGLFAEGYTEALILDVDEDRGYVQTFWAPEFHWIGGDLYLLFAVGKKVWGPQCHMMKLKKGGSILRAADWEEPVRVKRCSGAFLEEEGITLDMTYFRTDGVSYVVWSYRKDMGTPYDTGSMLYIATVDEKNPTVLTSEPVLLSRPLFGWENIKGTINNEGPYPLITEDTVYLTYSGGAAGGYTYVLGLLSIPRGSDLLNASVWRKECTPALTYYSIEGIYGPGHNSFFRDYNGDVMIMYHGEEELVDSGTRCTAMHRVHFNKKGIPALDLYGERDLNQDLAEVSIRVVLG